MSEWMGLHTPEAHWPAKGRPPSSREAWCMDDDEECSTLRRVRLAGDLFHPVTPPGAVKVTRPTRWGNPHKIGDCPTCGQTHDQAQAVAAYAVDLTAGRLRVSVADAREQLAGRDLACWCRADQPCHADVLLAVANMVAGGAG